MIRVVAMFVVIFSAIGMSISAFVGNQLCFALFVLALISMVGYLAFAVEEDVDDEW